MLYECASREGRAELRRLTGHWVSGAELQMLRAAPQWVLGTEPSSLAQPLPCFVPCSENCCLAILTEHSKASDYTGHAEGLGSS